jgi:hypothetical protein
MLHASKYYVFLTMTWNKSENDTIWLYINNAHICIRYNVADSEVTDTSEHLLYYGFSNC